MRVEEFIQYLNSTYGPDKEWPDTFEVSPELYGRCCQYVFDAKVKSGISSASYREVHIISVGEHNGLMFKGVELIIKREENE